MKIGFDLISDLCLSPEENFNWENKSTSLMCIIAGNISNDMRTVKQTLGHLSRFYQGIFYTPGFLEYENCANVDHRTEELLELCSGLPNVALLFQHVVIVDGIAILGCNGWSLPFTDKIDNLEDDKETARYEDVVYLKRSMDKLQKHLDVKKIVMVTHAVPNKQLYFGEQPKFIEDQINLDYCLDFDSEKKVCTWAFGSYEKIVDTTLHDINYVNNPYNKSQPYWAKRVNVEI